MAGYTLSLDGKTALVTGASGGLGAQFARVLADSGAKVALAARRVDKLQDVSDAIRKSGGIGHPYFLDVTDRSSIDRTLDAVRSDLGPVSVLVNNSGVARVNPALQQSEEDWDSVVDVNLKGAWSVAQATARQMAEFGGGSIINIASILGFRQSARVAPYAISKAGIVQMTRQLGLELARFDIRVNAIAPGYFETDINTGYFETEQGKKMIARIPMRRTGKLNELDGALLLLATDASSYITGTVITVDGGHLTSTL